MPDVLRSWRVPPSLLLLQLRSFLQPISYHTASMMTPQLHVAHERISVAEAAKARLPGRMQRFLSQHDKDHWSSCLGNRDISSHAHPRHRCTLSCLPWEKNHRGKGVLFRVCRSASKKTSRFVLAWSHKVFPVSSSKRSLCPLEGPENDHPAACVI